jgi:hypothetical protein
MGTGLCSKCHVVLTLENSCESVFVKHAGYCRLCAKTRIGTGRCYSCKNVLDISNSNPSTLAIGRGKCRSCEHEEYEASAEVVKKRASKWSKDNPERRKAIQAKNWEKYWRELPVEIKKIISNKNTARYREVKFGITHEEFVAKFQAQNGRCALCDKQMVLGKYTMLTPCQDHDHKTGELRDILCSACNLLLGYCYESQTILVSAIRYLQKHKGDSSIQIAECG